MLEPYIIFVNISGDISKGFAKGISIEIFERSPRDVHERISVWISQGRTSERTVERILDRF